VLESKGFSFVLGLGGIYNTLYEFPASYLEALSECKYKINSIMAKDQDEDNVISQNDPLYYDTSAIADMLNAIKHGNCDLAIQILDHFIDDLEKKNLPAMILRYIFSDILSELVHVGRQIQSPVSEQQASFVLTANNTAAFFEGCSAIIKDMCGNVQHMYEQASRYTTWKVLSYIERNFSKYELSLEKIASDLNMGINRVSQIIKRETG